MVHTCAINGCHNRANDAVKRGFFAIPTVRVHECELTHELSKRRRNRWIARINRQDFQPTKYTKVCSDHFVQGKPAALFDVTHPDWAPSLKLFAETTRNSSSAQKDKSTAHVKRYRQPKNRRAEQERHSVAQSLLELSNLQSEHKTQEVASVTSSVDATSSEPDEPDIVIVVT